MLDKHSGNILRGNAGGYVSVLAGVLSLVQEEFESMTFAKVQVTVVHKFSISFIKLILLNLP